VKCAELGRIRGLLIVNKADLATPAQLQTIDQTLRAINPRAQIVSAVYGVVENSDYRQRAAEMTAFDQATLAPEDEHEHQHEHEDALGLQSWSSVAPGVYSEQALATALRAAVAGEFGAIIRMKGIVQVQRGWINFDLVGAQTRMAAFAPRDGEQPRVVAIGQSIDEARLRAALAECLVAAPGQAPLIAATA
jgi:G3E family GTPase